MARYVFYTQLPSWRVREAVARLPRLFAGREADAHGVVRAFKIRMAFSWLSLVKLAFITKARGGTDEAGYKWPPLSPEYLAYGRGPKSTRTAGRHAPGGKDGFLTAKQLKLWRSIYARNLHWLSLRHQVPEAKGRAAAIAWDTLKKAGARTKLAVFGSRVVEILRDRGILFNSLQPGIVSASGATANYSAPQGQVAKFDQPGMFAVGTNVEYAAFHHGGTRASRAEKGRGAIRRALWPDADRIPASWHREVLETGLTGIASIGQLIAEGRL